MCKCIYTVSRKSPGDSDGIWYVVSWINLLQNDVNILHLTWIMSLHYLVKLELLIAHVLPLSCYRNVAIGVVQNTHHWSAAIDDTTDEWKPQWRHDPAWPTPFSVAVSVRPDQWWPYCTPSLAIVPTHRNQLNSNLANLETTVNRYEINSGVSFSDNAVVAPAWWSSILNFTR